MISKRDMMIGGAAVLSACVGRIEATTPARWRILLAEPSSRKQDDIVFVDLDHGWYGNGEGKLYRTSNGGETWEKIWERPGTFIRALGFIDAQHGFLGNLGVGFRPTITDPVPLYRTSDGGMSWTPVALPGAALLHGVCAIDILPRRIIFEGRTQITHVIHAAGRAFGPAAMARSLDGGETWSMIDLSAYAGMILDVKFLDLDTGFVCAASDRDLERSNALMLRTDDGCASWRPVYRSNRLLELCWKMSFATPRVGFATVQNNNDAHAAQRIIKTLDGGASWRELPLAQDPELRELGVGFVDEHWGWVGTSKSGFETRDGGRTWRAMNMGACVNKIRVLRHGQRFTAYAIGLNIARLDGVSAD